MSKITNNEELVIDLMNFSPYGALSQVFVMEAIQRYANEVIEQEEKILKDKAKEESEGKISFVDMGSWLGVAKNIKERTDKFYNQFK